jgi:hypothetical protein
MAKKVENSHQVHEEKLSFTSGPTNATVIIFFKSTIKETCSIRDG